MSKDNSEIVGHTIRFPRDLHNKVKEVAVEEKRSFNSQVVFMLEEFMNWRVGSKTVEDWVYAGETDEE